MRAALSIAGSDPSGGAGIQADLKTFHQFGVYGEAVITLITVQNTRRVSRVEYLEPALVMEQLRAVIEDIPPSAAKTGALGNADIVETVAREAAAFDFPLVVDPVMVSKHGASLIAPDAQRAVLEKLIPMAALVTPNVFETEILTGFTVRTVADAREAARRLCLLGARAALVKGGHFGDADATDVLYHQAGWREFTAPRVSTAHTHGTGCTYSAAITASLAAGLDLERAIERAKRFIARAIEQNPGLGGGSGPVNHFAKVEGK